MSLLKSDIFTAVKITVYCIYAYLRNNVFLKSKYRPPDKMRIKTHLYSNKLHCPKNDTCSIANSEYFSKLQSGLGLYYFPSPVCFKNLETFCIFD